MVDLCAAARRRFYAPRPSLDRADSDENDAVATYYEPPHRATIKGTSSNAPFETTLTFERREDGTLVEATTDLFLGGLAKPIEVLFRAGTVAAGNAAWSSSKALMESGAL